jgi:hypothetical protein
MDVLGYGEWGATFDAATAVIAMDTEQERERALSRSQPLMQMHWASHTTSCSRVVG